MFAPSKNLTRILKGKSWTIRRFATPASTTDGSPSKTDKPMFGTVPSHRSYIFLHATEPPTSFPARFSTPIQRALQLQVLKWGGGVNFAWFGHEHAPRNTGQSTSATAFSALGGRLEFPEITLDNVDEVAETLKRHADGPIVSASEEIHLYVCTHGARDCRCGDMGGAVFKALQDEVKRLVDVDPSGAASRVRLGEVAHVGGHQLSGQLSLICTLHH
ncbi:hypothetical protein H0H81_001700 [Sphagnurus paluster]|uniref:Sucrase/ferredoxin-like-domain-containing protein n=1 Tax=Sphagnurus paluster TaxID=117069 RepID=A0A9P7GRE4_9AGAR|nr:hypothetical protein H0H81_001700 [Sphagnurus paluster]